MLYCGCYEPDKSKAKASVMSMYDPRKNQPFDPNSDKFDYAGAKNAGMKRNAAGKYGSRDPKSGLIFKGRNHPTRKATDAAEKDLGYEIYFGPGGRDYSRKKKELPDGMQRGSTVKFPKGMSPVKSAYKGK